MEYAKTNLYETDAPLGLKESWIDMNGTFWLESLDGNRVAIPTEVRKLVAKRLREQEYRKEDR